MKITCSRARQLEITIFFYSPARDARPIYYVRENSRSRTRRVGSSHLVFGKSTVSLFWHCYVWEFGGFLCLAFFVISLLCNLNKILQSTEGNLTIILPLSSLSVALELNGYLEWLSLYFSECSSLLSKNLPNLSLNGNLSPNGLGHSLTLGVNYLLCVIGVSFQLYGQLKKSPHNGERGKRGFNCGKQR